MKYIFTLLTLLSLGLLGCDGTTGSSSSSESPKDLSVYRTYLNDSLPGLIATRDSLKALPDDMPNWLMNMGDEFTPSDWYQPAAFGRSWPRMITLIPYITKDGRSSLIFNYFGRTWIFVEKLAIKAGDKVYTTASYGRIGNDNYQGQVVTGGVYERLDLTKDQAAMTFIATHRDKPIRVKVIGEKGTHKFQIPNAHVNYIAQCHDIVSRKDELNSVKDKIDELASTIRVNLPTKEYEEQFDQWGLSS